MSTYAENKITIELVKKIKLKTSGKYSAFNQGVKVPVRIEKRYGINLDVRNDTKLGNYLKNKGYKSLSEMLKS